MNTFENDRRKCKKSENSAKYGLFSLKNQHFMLKIAICEKSRKHNNSSPDSPIWLIFGYMLVLVTSRIKSGAKMLIFSFFSEKSPKFNKNCDFGRF